MARTNLDKPTPAGAHPAALSRRGALLAGAAGLVGLAAFEPAAAAAAPPPMATSPLALAGMLGVIPLDSFDGDSDDAKMSAALSYLGSQTYKPTLVLTNRSYTFTRTFPLNINGLRISGPMGSMAREFRNTTQVHCPSGGLFSVASGHKDFAISGLSFTGTGMFIKTTSDILSDCDITECGFVGFTSVYSGKVLRCNFDRWYVNTAAGTQLDIGGSDSSFFLSGNSFMSGQIPTGLPYIRLGSLSQTRIGAMYCTPTHGYGLDLDAGSDAEGLEFFGWRQTAYGQRQGGPTGAGIRIRNGQAVTFHGGVLFNANTDGTAAGDIECWGGADHVFADFQFVGTHEGFTSVNLTAPAIYTEVPIVVRSPRSVGKRPRVLQQARDGLITCDDPTWRIITKKAR
jgi:hypothetical protein